MNMCNEKNNTNLRIVSFGGGGAQFSCLPQAQKTLLSALDRNKRRLGTGRLRQLL
jgi:hypothetical protein